MKRKIVKIDEEKCTGCGLCASACVEGAIEIVNGKARLMSESYCDGLGACLGECPVDAITIEEREADAFDIKAVEAAAKHESAVHKNHGHVCPGSMARDFAKRNEPHQTTSTISAQSELRHWPVQLKLVGTNAPCFQNADVLLAADCVPFAMADFHAKLLRGRALIIGCPKLDEAAFYIEKLTAILKQSSVRSLTVAHMEVPCCFGLKRIAEEAIAACGKKIPLRTAKIGIQGDVLEGADQESRA